MIIEKTINNEHPFESLRGKTFYSVKSENCISSQYTLYSREEAEKYEEQQKGK